MGFGGLESLLVRWEPDDWPSVCQGAGVPRAWGAATPLSLLCGGELRAGWSGRPRYCPGSTQLPAPRRVWNSERTSPGEAWWPAGRVLGGRGPRAWPVPHVACCVLDLSMREGRVGCDLI